ncbi:MAG: hypothetical protein ACRD0O_10555 [Acidimicrobiia bacterium]
MDDVMAGEVRRRFGFERARTGPPDGFPKLPDLPLGRYTDHAFYQAELERVFRRTWIFAGHVSEFPEPGSYRPSTCPMPPSPRRRWTAVSDRTASPPACGFPTS